MEKVYQVGSDEIILNNIVAFEDDRIVGNFRGILEVGEAMGVKYEEAITLIAEDVEIDGIQYIVSSWYEEEFGKLKTSIDYDNDNIKQLTQTNSTRIDKTLNDFTIPEFYYEKPTNCPSHHIFNNQENAKDGGNYDSTGNSKHYTENLIEGVRQQELCYGTIMAYMFCNCQIDKYNTRIGIKEGVPAEKDLIKRDWFRKAAKHYKIIIDLEATNGCTAGYNTFIPMSEEVLDVIKVDPSVTVGSVPYISLAESIDKIDLT